MKVRPIGCLVVLLVSGCNGGEDQSLPQPWRLKRWVTVGVVQYDQPPPMGKQQRSLWSISISGYHVIAVKGAHVSVDQIGGTGTLSRLQAMDSVALRKRYSESLTSWEALEERLRTETFTWPVQRAFINIEHWQRNPAGMMKEPALLEDSALVTPLYGSVVLPVGSEPGIPANPELAAVIAEFQRLKDATDEY